jgi:hypothetical protein
MTAGTGSPLGLGTPSGSQPDFAPPAGDGMAEPAATPQPPPQPQPQAWSVPLTGPPALGAAQPVAPHQWSVPDQRLVVPAPPPDGARPGRPGVRLVAVLLAAALVVVGVLSVLPLVTSAPPQAQPSESRAPAPIVTITPTLAPGTASTATAGGDLGTPITFRTAAGSGTVLVHSAVWTDAGDMAAEPGQRYLVLDLTLRCTKGALPVDALMLLAVGPGSRELPGFGPKLSSPLGGAVLKPGDSAHGEVGYSLVPGEVRVQVLDADLKPVAEIRIPAP